ncbi:uncharacterized protein FOMMEDRAFT_154115 [Fomitiporia mediterranea MF3/22]|uniref:uncharacterized protein n=1 Tax=Fomitiporia mediterranea (strain MF3/22) TaxID=694068 RepID=UPI00044099BB|nr:uncharacterized protein FOMMEDRAFT_154115 [Fomitiporia mediterranea MF3/22]EJD04964.1 hypothetical protein FOMMEDRAFT_154115 [Fomitiporia mediterranea MF3/22]
MAGQALRSHLAEPISGGVARSGTLCAGLFHQQHDVSEAYTLISIQKEKQSNCNYNLEQRWIDYDRWIRWVARERNGHPGETHDRCEAPCFVVLCRYCYLHIAIPLTPDPPMGRRAQKVIDLIIQPSCCFPSPSTLPLILVPLFCNDGKSFVAFDIRSVRIWVKSGRAILVLLHVDFPENRKSPRGCPNRPNDESRFLLKGSVVQQQLMVLFATDTDSETPLSRLTLTPPCRPGLHRTRPAAEINALQRTSQQHETSGHKASISKSHLLLPHVTCLHAMWTTNAFPYK